MIVSFPYSFRFDVDELYHTAFSLDLTEQEIADIRHFVHSNPGLPFWAMDYDSFELFDKMIYAHERVIVEGINAIKKGQGKPLISSGDIDWEDLPLCFDWPDLFKQ